MPKPVGSPEEQPAAGPSIGLTAADGMITGCTVCNQKGNLIRCDTCYYVEYCTPQHQELHHLVHLDVCNGIRQKRASFEAENRKLRELANSPFQDRVRDFYKNETLDYWRARRWYACTLLKSRTRIATEAALNHFEEMLHIDRNDNDLLREHVPFLYLRVGRDQQCYGTLSSHYPAKIV